MILDHLNAPAVYVQGKVAETGPPDTLLANPRSWFSRLVDMSGPAEAAALRAEANRHFEEAAERERDLALIGAVPVARASIDSRRSMDVRPSIDL